MKTAISCLPTKSEKGNFEIQNLSCEQKIALGEILGTIPSDGYFGISQSGLYNYILCVKDKDFVEYIAQDFLKLGISVNLHRRNSGLWYIEVSRKWFDKLLFYLKREDNKWLFSEEIINSFDYEFQAAIIRSFADADGTIVGLFRDGKHYSRRIAIYNKSKNLLSQLQLIFYSFGINSYIRKDRDGRLAPIKGSIIKFPTVYSLRITNYRNLKLFHDKINFKIARKSNKLNEVINSYRRIGKEYTKNDYWQAIASYKKLKNCREVSRVIGILPQTVQNWVLLGKIPRVLKLVSEY